VSLCQDLAFLRAFAYPRPHGSDIAQLRNADAQILLAGRRGGGLAALKAENPKLIAFYNSLDAKKERFDRFRDRHGRE
jgi:hypothetical protein